jgi:hypothetical protein
MFQQIVPSPSMGLLNCVLVDSEGLNNSKCWDYTGNTGNGLVQETSPLIVPWFCLTILFTSYLCKYVSICMNVIYSPCKMGAAHSSENISIKLWSCAASKPKRLTFEALLFYNAFGSGLCVSVTWSNTMLNKWDCGMTLGLPQWRLKELANRIQSHVPY